MTVIKIREAPAGGSIRPGQHSRAKAKTPGWLLGDEREPTRILAQSPLQRNLSKVSPRTWNGKIHNRSSQINLAPIEHHNRDLRYGDPNLMGCRGMGTEIGAGLSGTRTDPDFIAVPLQRNLSKVSPHLSKVSPPERQIIGEAMWRVLHGGTNGEPEPGVPSIWPVPRCFSAFKTNHPLLSSSCAFRGAFLNLFGKAAFGYFRCAAIARPLQDSRRPTS